MSWFERQLVLFLPAGEIKAYAGATAPKHHLMCDGAAISRTNYTRLFRAIGTTYGVGDGSTTFNVPDLQQQFPMGKSGAESLADTGGTFNHTHSAAAHSHDTKAHYHAKGTGATLSVDLDHDHAATSSGTQSADHTHDLPSGLWANVSQASADITAWTQTGGNTITTGNNSVSHTHATDLPALGALARSTTGTIGLVTGGVDGNMAQATASTTPSASGTGDPPYVVVNYIIRI